VSIKEATDAFWAANLANRAGVISEDERNVIFDLLILEVQAEMPCYGVTGTGQEKRFCGVNDPSGQLPLCPSCAPRRKLAYLVSDSVVPA